MATKTPNQQAHTLISLYKKLYESKYKRTPVINSNTSKWAFLSMIDDLEFSGATSVIEFYFTTPRPGHPLDYLLYNYEKLYRIKEEIAQDEVEREELRARTKAKVEEWERKHGNR